MNTPITPKIRLLLVDDEVGFLDSTARALSRRGFDVRRAQDGRAALLILERQTFDVMVTDVKMPGIDGVELFRAVRRRWPTLPVIVLTGHGSVQQAFQTCREGLFEYLTKPCDLEDLAHVAHRAVSQSLHAPWSGDAPPLTGAQVLLVDDEHELLASTAKVLRRRGVRVVTAAGGHEALDVILEQGFDVVVLDIQMPELDGLELCRRIKRLDPTTEVLFLTGHPSAMTALQGMEQGAFDYLVKPQDIDVLLGRIEQAYRKRLAVREEAQREIAEQIRERYPD